MEGKFQTSFIPKKSYVPASSGKPLRRTSPLTLIMGIIFVVVLAVALGLFGYGLFLKSRISAYKTDLDQAMAKLDPSTVEELSRTDSRMSAVKTLLGGHVDVSKLFAFLNDNTLQNVRFSDFSYDATNPQKITLTMNGQAHSFSDIALQSAQFAQPQNKSAFQNPMFSNLGLDSSGNVTFTFTAQVNPQSFLYSSVGANNAAAIVATSTEFSATSTSQ